MSDRFESVGFIPLRTPSFETIFLKVTRAACVWVFALYLIGMTEVQSSAGAEQKYGGAEGADAMYVKLVSSDDHEFYVRREHALTSGTIKAMLSGPGQFQENETNVVHFREIPSHVLQKFK
ncbi:unnamed protein product [Schistosoma bovis]|nr:unnamed protein product [Schistosoma bovis]CAH8618551.1 unnamed protein product [Schistosoma bovis]